MGIVNITPDSFSDGGKYFSWKKAVEHGLQLLDEGADWLDLGAESTRPKSLPISESEELDRLLPVLETILKEKPNTIISVDTYKSQVAKKAIQSGCCLVNDISSGENDPNMLPIISQFQSSLILMHKKGSPNNMQDNPTYDNVTLEVKQYLTEKISLAAQSGIQQILLDPGFGFGKTLHHNYELLKNLSQFSSLQVPIVVGISRKSMIGQLTGKPVTDRLLGTKVAETIAFLNGAHIFRVHDVKETKEMLDILLYYRNCNTETFSPIT